MLHAPAAARAFSIYYYHNFLFVSVLRSCDAARSSRTCAWGTRDFFTTPACVRVTTLLICLRLFDAARSSRAVLLHSFFYSHNTFLLTFVYTQYILRSYILVHTIHFCVFAMPRAPRAHVCGGVPVTSLLYRPAYA